MARPVIAFFADDYCLGSGKNSNFVESMPRINGHVVVSASRDAPLDGKQSVGNSETNINRLSEIGLEGKPKGLDRWQRCPILNLRWITLQ